jgi:uncharacterized protein YukE
MSTTLEARISQLRDAAERLESASANIRGAVDTSHGIVQALVARGVVSAAADQFFALYNQTRSTMSEWPDHLDDFSRLLEHAADAIEEAQRGQTEGGGDGAPPSDPGGDTGGDTGGNSGGNSGGVPPVFPPAGTTGSTGGTGGTGTGSTGTGGTQGTGSGGGTGTGGTGGASTSGGSGTSGSGFQGRRGGVIGPDGTTDSGDDADAPAEPQGEYFNQANQQLQQQVTEGQTQIEAGRANLTQLQEQRNAMQAQIDQMLTATGGEATPRIRGMQQQLADIDALINGQQTSIDELQQHIDQLNARLALVTPPPGADLDLIRSLEGSRTSEAILRATHQADNSVNCVNWVCTRAPIPPGLPTNAKDWVQNAINHPELGIQIGDHPLTGSVIVMQPDHPFADDRFGHVMYVERVDPDGAVWVTDNFNHEPVLLSRLTDEVSGPNIQYLYLPWQTQA